MRSPLKEKPLPSSGDSVDRRLQEVVFEKILQYFVLAIVMSGFAALEWIRWATEAPPSPYGISVAALIVIAFCVWKVVPAIRQARQLKLGRDAERTIGQFLEGLRASGARVVHDVAGDGFNLDHIVIHGSGVYVIETKARSKPDRGQPVVEYDGQRVLVDGRAPGRDPVVQARAARSWLKERLQSATGRQYPIRPVVIYVNWYVKSVGAAKQSDVWVLNQKALPAFIAHEPTRLKPEEVALCADYLERYARGLV